MAEETKGNLELKFKMYAELTDSEEISLISLKSINKWFKQAGVLNAKNGVSSIETAMIFSKTPKKDKWMDFKNFILFLEAIGRLKKWSDNELDSLKKKLKDAGKLELSGKAKQPMQTVLRASTDWISLANVSQSFEQSAAIQAMSAPAIFEVPEEIPKTDLDSKDTKA